MNFKEINVIKLKKLIDSKAKFTLLDVRTDNEVMVSRIDSSIHIPMHEVADRLNEINKEQVIIVQCKSGKRSAKVCEYLLQHGYLNVKNLTGGIIAWSQKIDPSILVL